MIFEVRFTDLANEGLVKLAKSEPQCYQKALTFIDELKEHPRTGTGHPEQLSGDRAGQWSRRLSKKHRMVYEIHDTEIVVLVLAAYGHYDDK